MQPQLQRIEQPTTARLLSLDAYRGLIMLFLVSNGFGFRALLHHPKWSWLAVQVEHIEWEGMTLWDLIQPAFMLMVGVAMLLSLARRQAEGATFSKLCRHIVGRSLGLLVICFLITNFNRGWPPVIWLTNVLGQIAMGTVLVFLVMRLRLPFQFVAAAAILAGYWAVFALFPGRQGAFSPGDNIGARIDYALFHIKNKGYYTNLNFVSSAVTMLFGVWAGMVLRQTRSHVYKIGALVAMAAGCIAGGVALAPFIPIVKRLYTPSFTIASAAPVLLILALLYWVVEVKGYRRWCWPVVVFGSNSIFIYCFSEVAHGWLSRGLSSFTNGFRFLGDWGAVVHNLSVLAVMWSLCYWLYRRKIFFKV